jgi:hypothetical protein
LIKKCAIYLSLGLHIKEVQAIGESFSLKKEHPAVQKIKFSNFLKNILWVIFALLHTTANCAKE